MWMEVNDCCGKVDRAHIGPFIRGIPEQTERTCLRTTPLVPLCPLSNLANELTPLHQSRIMMPL
jgi:hypothetical protein